MLAGLHNAAWARAVILKLQNTTNILVISTRIRVGLTKIPEFRLTAARPRSVADATDGCGPDLHDTDCRGDEIGSDCRLELKWN